MLKIQQKEEAFGGKSIIIIIIIIIISLSILGLFLDACGVEP